MFTDDVCGDEDHEDSEYNFMAEDQKEEKEEYRNDRAVRITSKLLQLSSSFFFHLAMHRTSNCLFCFLISYM